jgi:hypothetical protein
MNFDDNTSSECSCSYSKDLSSSSKYDIQFPSGSSMGFELEPVIVSNNPPRQIGCQIRDFYFGTDFIDNNHGCCID